jgi:hypothetical protein
MKRTLALLLTVALLLITAHRLPAPISEIESPTPAPAQSAKPKRTVKPKVNPEASESATNPARQQSSPKQSRFAGTWGGIMPEVPWGDVPTELIVDQNESTMEWREAGKPKTALAAKTILNGDTVSARFLVGMTTAVWYISPKSDGVTANVRLTAFMNDQTAVFHRTASESTAKSAR